MRKQYEKSFKEMIVGLLDAGHPAKQIGEDYQLNDSMIRRWKRESIGKKPSFTGQGNPRLTEEEKEISRLKKALREAEMERDILKKALSIFSKSDRNSIDL